ncbi:ABC transporter ATP-binding protein [Halomonas sp. WWR20]
MDGVKLKNVEKNFGDDKIIHGVSMDIAQGEFAVFVGPSGCGKSTLLRTIAGLEECNGGSIKIEGNEVTGLGPAQRGVAMVFQSYALYPHLTVFENMAFCLRLAKRKKPEVEEKVRQAARILQLEEHLSKKPSHLSGGQRQRVAIGRAIVRQPQVFLFDEPLSNLDAELRVQMRLELARLHKQIGATMIYVTHDQVEAMTLADKIFVLKHGTVQQAGRPLDLYDDPDNQFVAGFIGSPSMNFMTGKVVSQEENTVTIKPEDNDGGVVTAQINYQQLDEGLTVTLGVRPEHLEITDNPQAGIHIKVDMAEELGGVSYLHAHTLSGQHIIIERRGARDNMEGKEIFITTSPQKALLFDSTGKRLR